MTGMGSIKPKSDHMAKGAVMAGELVKDLPLSQGQQKEIVRLVAIHDKLEILSTKNEILLFEADSLGQIDIERVKSTFKGKDREKFLDSFQKRRIPRFRTEAGKRFVVSLWLRAKENC